MAGSQELVRSSNGGEGDNSAELSFIYWAYVIWEAILINLLGFVTLFWQCELQAAEEKFLERFPFVPKIAADNVFGHYWLNDDLNCSTPAARCLTYMVTGWLMIAGLLQVFINFDGLRRSIVRPFYAPGKVALQEWDCPRGIKILCMYAYFLCDWFWVVLMYHFRDTIGWQQIVGSAVDIAIRLYFVTKPSRMFKNSPAHDVDDHHDVEFPM